MLVKSHKSEFAKLRNMLLQMLLQIDYEKMQEQIDSLGKQKQLNEKLQQRLVSQLLVIEQLNERAVAREDVIKSYEIALNPEKLKKIRLNFEISHVENAVGPDTWKVITSYCKLAGCEQAGFSFNSRWRATQKAVELTLQGGFPISVSSCAKCYEAYLRRCF